MKKRMVNFLLRLKKFFIIFLINPARLFYLSFKVEHIYGPHKIECKINELIVLTLVRDGEFWIQSFIEHYFAMGVKHIVIFDNGSIDNTISIAQTYDKVTIIQTIVPFKRNKLVMRQYLIKRFGKGKWTLYVDIDELFDYPFSDVLTLNSLLDYLNANSYTAVVAHMLDMFADKLLLEPGFKSGVSLKSLYPYYDLSDITKMDYYFPRNAISNKKIKLLFGGIRRTIFGTGNSIGVILTKHPLFFLDGKVRPMLLNEHGISNASVADFSCVLYHYKLVDEFFEYALRYSREEGHHNNSAEYKRYVEILSTAPQLQIAQPTSQKLDSTHNLVDNGFLRVSEDYLTWVKKHRSFQQ